MANPRYIMLTTAVLSALVVTKSHAETASVIVFDASGSMWAQLENGKSRIEIARDVMDDFAADRDAQGLIGVVSYGHTRRGDCGDIETVLPVAPHAAGDLAATIRTLDPKGKTPLTDAMAQARDLVPRTAEAADIILITDGLENCGGDPCALAAEFAAEGIDLRAHVVGFAMEAEAVETLSCIPDQTGGQLFTTQSGAELAAALTDVALAAPAVEVDLAAPFEVTAGATFEVTVEGGDSDKDYLLIARDGSPEEASRYRRMGNRVGGDGTYEYTAPSDSGEYELRYHLVRDNTIAARHPLTVLAANTRMEVPTAVDAEAKFEVSIAGGVSGYVVIVEEGRAPDDIVSRYARMKNSVDGDEGTLTRTAPETPGRYLLRYHAGDDQRLLVEQPLVVSE